MLVLKLFLVITFVYHSTNAAKLDPCRLIRCEKPEVPCLEMIPNSKCYFNKKFLN